MTIILICVLSILSYVLSNSECYNNSVKINSIVQNIKNMVNSHNLLNHDLLLCFANAKFKDMNNAIKVFAENHYSYSKNFKNFLSYVSNRLNDDSKHVLEKNMNEEEGIYQEKDLISMEKLGFDRKCFNGVPHRHLIKHFLTKLNISDDVFTDINQPGYQFTQYMFDKYNITTPCEALSIIAFGIEDTVSTLYSHIIQGLEKTDIAKCDYVFFPLHVYIDDGHADALKNEFKKYIELDIINDTNECTFSEVHIKEVLDKRKMMYDDIRKILFDNGDDICLIPQQYDSNSRESEIKKASLLTQNMFPNEWSLKQKIALTSRILADDGHGKLLSGQVTCRDPDNKDNKDNKDNVYMYTNTYGYPFEITKASNILRVDENLNVVDDELNIIDEKSPNYRMPNRATRFHMYIYKNNPDINCVIHSHPIYASALSMMGEELVINHMDVMGLYNRTKYISEWPGVPFGNSADREGQMIIDAINEGKNSLLLGHHGLTVVGKNIEEVTHLAYFFELAAKLQILSKSATFGKELPNVNITEAIIARDWRMQDGPVKAYYFSWVEQAFRNNHSDALE